MTGFSISGARISQEIRQFLNEVPTLPASSALISRLSIYAALIVSARILNSEEFGIFTLVLAALGVLSALVTGGGDMWLNRVTFGRRAVAGQAPRLWVSYLAIVILISLILIAGSFLFSAVSPSLQKFHGIVFVAILIAAFMGTTEALLAILRAGGSVQLFFIVRDMAVPVTLVGIIMLILPSTAMEVLYIYLCLWIVASLAVFARLIWIAPSTLPAVRQPRAALLPLAVHTFGLVYGNMTSRLSIYVDAFILAYFVSLTQIGEYRVAAQFAIGFLVVQHFSFLGLPWQMRQFTSRRLVQSDVDTVSRRQNLLVILAMIAMLALWFLADPLLALFGQRFSNSIDVFRILLIIRFASLLWGPQHELLISSGQSIKDAHANVIALLVWLITFFPLISICDPIYSAIVANSTASLSSHWFRHVALGWFGLPRIFGHPFGIVPSLLLYAVAIFLASRAFPC